MKKRILSMVLSLCMILSICTFEPIIASAETSGICGDNLTWVLDDEGTLTISGNGAMSDYQQYESPWYMSAINNIVIENGVTTIGDYAFCYLENLTKISIPESLLSIGEGAFERCYNLSKITIPENVSEIGEYAFSYCHALNDISGMKGLSTISPGLFYVCTALNYLEIPDTVSTISEYAFFGCESLTDIKLPNSLKIIENCAFYSCQKLNSVFIPNSVTEIGEYAFYVCDKLTTVYYSGTEDEWKEISIGAENSNLTNANIHYNEINVENFDIIADFDYEYKEQENTYIINNEEYLAKKEGDITYIVIDNHAILMQVDDVGELFIPQNIGGYPLDTIHQMAFFDAFKLSGIAVDSTNTYFSSQDGVLFNKDKTKLLRYPIICDWVNNEGGKAEYVIPDTVTVIEDYAFRLSGVQNIGIPNSVNYIGIGAFSNCFELERINLPAGITKIEDGAFSGSALKEVTLPRNITILSEDVFSNCFELERINLPAGITKIEDGAFYSCAKLKNITIPENVELIGAVAFAGCESLIKIEIPNSVTSVGYNAFINCTNLEKVKLPSTLIDISNAFNECVLLKTAGPKDGDYNIEYDFKDVLNVSIFEYSNNDSSVDPVHNSYLQSVIIPEGVLGITGHAFVNCTDLESIELPKTLIFIEDYAFINCENLKNIYFTGSEEEYESIATGYNENLGNATIHYNSKLSTEEILPINGLSISAPANSYAGTYYTFEATFDAMPTSAFLQFDSPADGWTWFSDEYCSTNPVFYIPIDEIVEKDGKYVYQTSFVIYSSGNESDNYNRQVRVAADINGTRQYSEGAKFVVQPTPARPKNTIGYLYEQTSNPSGDTVAPEIKDVEVTKTNGKYRLTIKDITAENEEWVFFYWQTDNGEFEKVTDDFKTVDLTVSADANVTVTMGDGCGYITTKTIEIN